MRTGIVIAGCVIALQMMSVQPSSAQPRVGVTFGAFYDGLSPYGDWISVSGGVYAWRPHGIAVGWRPYTIGRWCWTDQGWFWASDEPWGWAAYHYGRWYYDDYYGWIWIPGYDWAPAWVEWRYGGDYVGWAPLSPYAVFNVSWGIHYRARWYTPVSWWSFVGCKYITSPNLHRYVYRTENNTRYIGVTRTAGSVRYSGGRIITRGPEPGYVERRGNVRIETAQIRDMGERGPARITRNGGREELEVYRPRIENENVRAEESIRPPRVRDEGGKTIDLDTRRIDVRSREVAREEGRDLRRAEEYRTRTETGRSGGSQAGVDRSTNGAMLKGPVDDATRDRNGRSVDNQPERRREDAGSIERRQPDRESQRQPGARSNERRRDNSGSTPQREYRSRTPERRMDAGRSASPRNSGAGERRESGRSGRDR